MNRAATPASAPTRFEALDGWRGVCACLVVLFHFHGYSPLYVWPFIRNSYLFVDFFFVLSGFVIAWNYSNRLDTWPGVRKFFVLRVGRVYPLHLFMLLCFVAYEGAVLMNARAQGFGDHGFEGENGAFSFLTNLLLIHSLNIHDGLTWNGPSWSISTELWTYVVFALLSLWVGMRNWMLLVAAVAAPVLLFSLSTTGMDTTYDYGIIRCLFGFALGAACHRMHGFVAARAKHAGTGAMTLAECGTVAAVIMFVAAAGTSALSFLAPYVFALAVLVFAVEGGLVSRIFTHPVLKWLGTLSYSIYLTHFLFVLLVPRVVKRVLREDLWTAMPLPNGQYLMAFGRDNLEGTLFYALVLIITLAFSALTYRWVETPGREWTRRWLNRPGARARAKPAQASQPH